MTNFLEHAFGRRPAPAGADADTAAALLDALLDALPQGVAAFDREHRLVRCNARFVGLLGLPPALGQPGTPFAALVEHGRGEGAERGRTGLLGMDATPPAQPGATRRFERQMPGGAWLAFEASALPEGGLLLSCADAAPQRAAQAVERQLQFMLDELCRHTGAQLSSWDASHHCRAANPAFLQALGKPAPQVIGRHLSELWDPAERAARQPRIAAALGGQPQVFEELQAAPGGAQRLLQVHLVPAPGRAGFLMLALDVTEQRRQRDSAARAEQSKVDFIANMGHELRTPLNAVMGMLQLAQGTLLTPQQADYLGKAQGAARTLLGVLGDVLDLAEAQDGRIELRPREFEVDELLRDLGVVFAHDIGDRPVDFVFEVDSALPSRLEADDLRLRQVLLHLGGNAIKFTPQGRAVLRLARGLDDHGRSMLEVSVQDTGIGIDPQRLPQLMADIGQAEGGTTRRHGGAGLGLAICRRMAGLMGGRLDARSEPGVGSVFSFRIPVGEPAGEPAAPAHASPDTGLGALRVLVASHCEASRQAQAAQARALGWQVVETGTLAQTLDVLSQQRHLHAVLVDWRLDGSEPLAAALAASAAARQRPLAVVVTGPLPARDALARLHEAQRARLGPCLVRPATASQLAQAMAQALGLARERGAPRTPAGRPLAGLRILLAEDNENNQIVARELLTGQGAKVDIAVDGLDTLTHLVAGGEYDAILMDWQMPEMDGLTATREIRQIVGFENIPIIALTANATAQDRLACLEAGMDAHLAKPVDVQALVRTLLAHTRPGNHEAMQAAPVAEADLPLPELDAALAQALGQALADVPAPVVDRDAALARLGGDETLYEGTTAMFRAELPALLEALRTAGRGDDRAGARRTAHTLKGLAATLGAGALAQAAGELEQALASPPAAREAALYGEVAQRAEAAMQALQRPDAPEFDLVLDPL